MHRQFLSEKDFVGASAENFYNLLSQIAEDPKITDIEIIEDSFVRCGVLKNMRIFKPATKFVSSQINEILNIITPDKYKDPDGDIKYFPICFSFSVEQKGHYRVIVMQTRTGKVITMRRLSYLVPDWDLLGIPVFVRDIFLKSASVFEKIEKQDTLVASGTYRGGLILITGPMGSGKTTTLASMIKLILDNLAIKVLTIEDPIEYVHTSSLGFVNQIEVGTHVDTQHEALFHALRSNASVIALGEVRNKEELQVLLKASEVGCLSLATFHVPDCASALERICYELESDIAVRVLASVLIGIINQRLFCIETPEGKAKFFLAVEYLPVRGVKVIQDFIINRKFIDIRSGLERRIWAGSGAKSMEMSLKEHLANSVITKEMYERFKQSVAILQ